MLTRKTTYGIRALVNIARAGERALSVADIAEREGIPQKSRCRSVPAPVTARRGRPCRRRVRRPTACSARWLCPMSCRTRGRPTHRCLKPRRRVTSRTQSCL